MPNNKYNQLKRQYSIDGGLTWHDLLPMVYKVGNVIETNSNCTDSDGCRWVVLPITEAYDCDSNYNMYQIEAEECLNEFGVFVRSGNIRRYRLIEDYSLACGYSGPICTPTSITSYSYDIVYNGGVVEWNEVATPVVYKITTISDIDKGCNETSSTNREEITDYGITYSPSSDNTTEEDRLVTATVKYEGENIGSFEYVQKGKICEPSTSITYTNYVITYNGGEVEWNEVTTPVVTATEIITITDGSCNTTITSNTIEIIDYEINYSPWGNNYTQNDRLVSASVKHNNNVCGSFNYTQKKSNYTGCNETLSFEFTGTVYYKLNNKIYTANSSNSTHTSDGRRYIHTVTLSELGIDYLFNLEEAFSGEEGLYKILCFPDTSKVGSMSSMFNSCTKLSSIDNLSFWNVSKVYNMSSMFKDCALGDIDLSGWDVSNVTYMDNMFWNYNSTSTINISNWSLTQAELGNFNNMGGKIIYMYNCDYASVLCLTSDSRKYKNVVTNSTYNPTPIDTQINIPNLNKIKLNNTIYEINGITSLSELGIDCLYDAHEMLLYGCGETVISSPINSNTLLANSAFYSRLSGCKESFTIDCSRIGDTSNVKSMAHMFPPNYSNNTITNLSLLNTSSVTNMCSMLYSCNVEREDIEKMNVSNVKNMRYLFFGVSGISSLDLTNWDVTNVVDALHLFSNSDAQHLNLSNWNPTKLINATLMFNWCSNLQTLDVSSWDVSNVYYYGQMFYNCGSLMEIKVKSGTENWWYDRLSENGIQERVNIISN